MGLSCVLLWLLCACQQAYVNFCKGVMTPCYEAGLKQSGREQAIIDDLLQQFFTRLKQAAVKSPTPVDFPFASALLRRRTD